MIRKTLSAAALLTLLMSAPVLAQDLASALDPDKPVLVMRYDLTFEGLRVLLTSDLAADDLVADDAEAEGETFTAPWVPPAYDD